MSFLQILAILAVILVTAVLLFGLLNLMRGGSANLSQKLMRARVIIQLIAIILLMTALYFGTRDNPLPPSAEPAAPAAVSAP